MIRALALIGVLALVGCGADPRAQVSASQAALAASGQVALTYMRLPSAKPTVKMQIKVAYDAAYDALVAAQADADAGRPVNAAAVSAAIASLQAILATLPKGN